MAGELGTALLADLGFLLWGNVFYHTFSFDSPGWASGLIGIVFLSGYGLVTHSGLLNIAKFVAELVAHLEFGTHSDNCFLVGGPHATDFSTGS